MKLFKLLLIASLAFISSVSIGQTVYISEVVADNGNSLIDQDGDSPDWLELYNSSDQPVLLNGWYLTDSTNDLTKWIFPATNISAKGFLLVFASNKDRAIAGSELHTNFKLSASGEYLALIQPNGTTIAEEHMLPAMQEDISFGYAFTNGEIDPAATGLLTVPTPEIANTNINYVGLVETPMVIPERGFYDTPFMATVSNGTSGASIYFTLDGSEPTESSELYSGPVAISSTANFRVRAFKTGWKPSFPRTDTYIFVDDVVLQPESEENIVGINATSDDGQYMIYGMNPGVVNKTYYDASNQVVTVQDSLKAIPTISITTDHDNLYDPSTGIYVNSAVRWEVPASIELMNPDGTEGFEIYAGLRIRGGWSRHDNYPKHSFRLFFREEYGAGKLKFPMFGTEGAEAFDKIDLRTSQNYNWAKNNDDKNNFLRDVFARDSALAMGQENPRSRYYHLYLNGQYWGLYMTEERPVASFGESYYGGDKEDYDAVKVRSWTDTNGYTTEATDGTLEAYERLYAASMAGFTNNVDYFSVQGLDTTGEPDASQERLLDAENMIDYLLVIYYMAASDNCITSFGSYTKLNNMYALYNRENPDGFKWFQHDSEHALDTNKNPDFTGPFTHSNFTLPEYFNAMTLHEKLSVNEEYKIKFADRVYKHFKNDGAMVLSNSEARLDERAAQIDRAIVANAARWGNTSRDRDTWINAVATTRTWLARSGERCSEVISYLDADGLIPSIAPPQFNQNGGLVTQGTTITLTEQEADPVAPPTPSSPYYGTPLAVPGTIEVEDYDLGGPGVAYFDADSSNRGGEYRPSEGVDIEDCDEGGYNIGWSTAGEWRKYTVNIASAGDYQLTTRVAKNSGTTAFHIEVNDIDVTGSIEVGPTGSWQTWADISTTVGLTNGEQVVKFVVESADLNINYMEFTNLGTTNLPVELPPPPPPTPTTPNTIYYTIDGTDPRAIGGGISGSSYSSPIAITRPTHLKARTRTSIGEWSALAEATFVTPEIPLAITEVMYHAPAGNPYDFIEIQNISDQPVTLKGYKLDNAIEFNFKNGPTSLGAGEYIVVVDDLTAFSSTYPANGILIAGEYSGDLSNSGETIDLEFRNNDLISFTYSDARNWPQAADGAGHSLVPLDSSMDAQEQGSLDYGGNWRASSYIKGSPGTADPVLAQSVLLNEIVAHTDTGLAAPFDSNDQIELYNPTDSAITLNGWHLSDDRASLTKFAIPDGTTIPAFGFLSFDEDDFHPERTSGFGLDKAGEQVFLSAPGRVVDVIRFKGQENGVSYGRYPDGTPDWMTTFPTIGSSNQLAPRTVQISELMYNPVSPGSDLEYIQLENISTGTVVLENETGSYRIDGGVSYTFPAGSTLLAGEKLWLVSFDPTVETSLLSKFRSTYRLSNSDLVYGPYKGELSDRGERVALERPQESDDPLQPLDLSWVVVDELYYFDRAPWPTSTDGTGIPLVRTSLSGWSAPPGMDLSATAFRSSSATDQTPAGHVFEVWSADGSLLNYSISSDSSWLTASPASGSSTGEHTIVTLSYDTTGLTAGNYTGRVAITSSEAINSPRGIDVTLNLYDQVVDHFSWSPIGVNQTDGQPFNVTLTARDIDEDPVRSFSGSVSISAVEGFASGELNIGEGSSVWNYPMSTYWHDSRTQVIYLNSELADAGSMTSLALNVNTKPGQTLGNWTIRMRHTPLDSYGTAPVWESDWTTVYQENTTISATGWTVFEFDTPFEYNGTDNLMIDFSHNNSSWTTDGYCASTDRGVSRALYSRTDSGFGDPLSWSGPSSPDPSSSTTVPDIKLGFLTANPISISPTQTGHFVNGIWQGLLTVHAVKSNVVLQVEEYDSNPFNVLVTLDADADGLPDDWETAFFGLPSGCVATNDADHDGFNNQQEYISGTDPTNAASLFEINRSESPDGFIINWIPVESRFYDIVWTSNLAHGFQTLEAAIPYPVNSYTDQVHSASSAGFYGVTVRLPFAGDFDGDGMPDIWEMQYFMSMIQAESDWDNDGQSNLQEYIADTNPTNSASLFIVDNISGSTLYWSAKPDRTYSVFWTDDLSKPFRALASGLTTGSYTDNLHAGSPANYYRIQVEKN